MAELTLDVANVVLDETFPERLQRVLSVPNRMYAQDARLQRKDRASDFIVSARPETLKPNELPMALTIWQSWRVRGSNGIQESSSPLDEATRIPMESLELFDGSRNCFLQLKAGVDRGNLTPGLALTVSLTNGRGYVTIQAPRDLLTSLEEDVRALMDDYVVHQQTSTVSPPRPFKIFIAYGGGRAWEVVRDYLQAAGFQVDAFTEQERAGEITLDVVEGMIRAASIAVIVMTGADELKDGSIHARQNVVHEAGFAQGALGRRNTVILREAGVTLPTNVDGLTYIEFKLGEIHTTKDRVVALVSRLQTLV